MRLFAAIALVLVSAVVAGVVVYRLSSDALALIIGVFLGMLALVPTLIVLTMVFRRGGPRTDSRETAMYPMQQPPVIVISGGQPQVPTGSAAQLPSPAASAQIPPPPSTIPRKFRIMGYEMTQTSEADDELWDAY